MSKESMNLMASVLSVVIGVAGLLRAEELKPVRGEDLIEVPKIGEGLCLHNLFQSNMVVQRGKPIRVWGWAAPGEKVTVTFAGQEQAAVAADDRSWSVAFPPMEANAKPVKMSIKGSKETLSLENILVGDVWVLGGQSNMEFPVSKVENGALELVSANYENIRVLTVPLQFGPEPEKGFSRIFQWSGWSSRHFRKGDWDVCTPEIVGELSAIGYVFVRRLHTAAQIPIGVIDASVGGTTVETWTPNAALRACEDPAVTNMMATWDQKVAEFDSQKDLEARVEKYQQRLADLKEKGKEIPSNMKEPPSDLRPGPAMDKNRPGNCYAGMIAPLAGLAVKGAIFHQGYNNCFNGSKGADMYAGVFPLMIAAWRSAFGDAEMPFGIISLCTQGGVQTRDSFLVSMVDAGPYIREAQYKTFLDLYKAGDKNIGFVSCYDQRRRWYHPQLKIKTGERIARWALATQYGFEKELRWKPPMLERMEVADGRILLHMDTNVGAVDDGSPILGFAIAGADRKFQPAEASHLVTGKDSRGRDQKDMKVVVLSSPLVPKPVHYRYAWARSPLGNLQPHHNTDIPFATQRSDSWGLYEVPVLIDDSNPRGARNELIKTMRLEDMRRRLFEAEKLIEEEKAKFEKEMASWNAAPSQ